MFITWVRPTVRKVKLSYDYITGAEVARLHGMMQGKEFSFTYPDYGSQTIRGYAGKDSYSMADLSQYPDEGGLYKDYSIDIIEM